MKVGMMLPCVHSVALNVMTAQAVEQMGADSLWLPDHLLGFWHPEIWKHFPAASAIPDPDAFLDPFCVATAVAVTTSLPIGTCVSDASRRGAIDLVRCSLTVNEIATGGFTLGIGSGERESTVPFGYDFTKPVSNLERTLGEIRCLLDTGNMPGDSVGRTGVDRAGPNSVPPVWVGAQGGRRSLRLAGEYGDGWLALLYQVDRFAELLAGVREFADKAGRRPPVAGMFPLTFFGESRERVLATIEANPLIKLLLLFADSDLWARYGIEHPHGPGATGHHTIPHELDPEMLREFALKIPMEMFDEWVMLGSGTEIAARLEPFARAGLEHVVIADMSAIALAPEDAPAALGQLAVLAPLLKEM
jgi:phthiodiolone/phenolphthiodiolone dimycocerosates ketoreductase